MENYRFGYLAEFVDPQSYWSRVRVEMGGSCYKTKGLFDIHKLKYLSTLRPDLIQTVTALIWVRFPIE